MSEQASSRRTEQLSRRTEQLVGLALLVLFCAVAVASARIHSGVPDEVAVHVPAGFLFLDSGRFAGGLGNPPLGQLWVGLPAWLGWGGEAYVPFEAAGLLAPRLAVVALALLGAVVLYGFGRKLAGPVVALCGLFFLATSPTFGAHASLATLDVPIAVWTLLSVACAYRAAHSLELRDFAVLGLMLGAACATKVQGLALLPLVVVQIVLARADGSWPARDVRRRALAGSLVAALASYLVIHAAYGFGPALAGEWLPTAFLDATRAKLAHSERGHLAFLLGEYSTTGWWSYFPIAFAVKSPLALLAMVAVGLAVAARSRAFAVWLLLPIALFSGLAISSSVDIGIRHLLPAYPFLFVVAGLGLARVAAVSRIAAAAIVAVQLGELALMAPHGLAYFNPLAGGSARGERILVDSNHDWGQHDGALRDYLARTAGPAPVAIDPDPLVPRAGRTLVGTSALHGLLGPGPRAYTWLRVREPSARIADTWLEYRLSEQDLAALAPTRRGTPVSRRMRPERVALARHVLRARMIPAASISESAALDLAVACNAVFEYACALDQARGVLSRRPAHHGAFWLASEITARRRLGTLLFEGRELLDGFAPLEPAEAWLPADELALAAKQVGAVEELERLHRGLARAASARRDPDSMRLHLTLVLALSPDDAGLISLLRAYPGGPPDRSPDELE